jgi:serine/threonine protein kinase
MSVATRTKKKIFDGRFEILGIVGRGSGSVVYHARHLTPQATEVALKVLQPRKGLAPSADRLRKEALAMVSARHDHAIKLDDFQSMEHLCYLSMEYAPCADLRQFLLQSAVTETAIAVNSSSNLIKSLDPESTVALLSPSQGEKFFFQLASALATMHRAGILHRDIKPDNILVTDPETVKFGDFGVALLPGEEPAIPELQAGVGTLDYMAPEIFEGSYSGSESDVYLLGVTFYELFTGHHPFKHASLASILSCRMDDVIEPLSSLAPSVPAYLAAVIHRCMRYDRAERYRDGTALMQDLERQKALYEEASHAPSHQHGQNTETPRQSGVTIAFPSRKTSAEEIKDEPSLSMKESMVAAETAAEQNTGTLGISSHQEPEQPVLSVSSVATASNVVASNVDAIDVDAIKLEESADPIELVPSIDAEGDTSNLQKKKKRRRRKRKPSKEESKAAAVSDDIPAGGSSMEHDGNVDYEETNHVISDYDLASDSEISAPEIEETTIEKAHKSVAFETPALPKEAEDLIASLERIFQQEATTLSAPENADNRSPIAPTTSENRAVAPTEKQAQASNRQSKQKRPIDPTARIRLNTGAPDQTPNKPKATNSKDRALVPTRSRHTNADDAIARDILADLEKDLDGVLDGVDGSGHGSINTQPKPRHQQPGRNNSPRFAGRASMKIAPASSDYPSGDDEAGTSDSTGSMVSTNTRARLSTNAAGSNSAALARYQSRVAADSKNPAGGSPSTGAGGDGTGEEKSASQRLDDALMALLGSKDLATGETSSPHKIESSQTTNGRQPSSQRLNTGRARPENGVQHSHESRGSANESSFLGAYQNHSPQASRGSAPNHGDSRNSDDTTLYQEDTLYPGGSNIHGYPASPASNEQSLGRSAERAVPGLVRTQNGSYANGTTSNSTMHRAYNAEQDGYSTTPAGDDWTSGSNALGAVPMKSGNGEQQPSSQRPDHSSLGVSRLTSLSSFSAEQRKKFVTTVVGIVIALFVLDVILQATTNSGLANRAAKAVGLSTAPLLRRSEQELVRFPELSVGVYSGSVTGVGISGEVPLSVLAVNEEGADSASKLFVLVGIEGWIPAQVSLPAKSPDGTFSSNGFRLLLKGHLKKTKSGERTIEGSLTNITARKKGLFNLKQVTDTSKESKK